MKKNISEIKYKIPDWCYMDKDSHEDGVGGCWGISYGYVETEKENCCKNYMYYKGKIKNDKY